MLSHRIHLAKNKSIVKSIAVLYSTFGSWLTFDNVYQRVASARVAHEQTTHSRRQRAEVASGQEDDSNHTKNGRRGSKDNKTELVDVAVCEIFLTARHLLSKWWPLCLSSRLGDNTP